MVYFSGLKYPLIDSMFGLNVWLEVVTEITSLTDHADQL